MWKTGGIFGPQLLLLMYLQMPVPIVAEDSAVVTFMRTGPIMFHVEPLTTLTPRNWLQLSWLPRPGAMSGPTTI